jgi:hypothetical protein
MEQKTFLFLYKTELFMYKQIETAKGILMYGTYIPVTHIFREVFEVLKTLPPPAPYLTIVLVITGKFITFKNILFY